MLFNFLAYCNRIMLSKHISEAKSTKRLLTIGANLSNFGIAMFHSPFGC
jgi:hypothetical protein